MPERFIEKRIKVTLHDASLLRRGDEKRHHFRLSVNLSEDGSLVGLPEWMQNNYALMQKASNRTDGIKSKTKLENMSLGFYSTEKIRSKFFSQVNGVTLSKFTMERNGEDDDATVLLYFSAYFSGRSEIHAWTWDHKSADFYMDFEQQQAELDMEGAEEDDDSAEE